MKALSIKQPWAWLIVNGHKPIENRSWRTSFRGQFLIHAGKKWGREQLDDLARVQAQFPHIVMPDGFELGAIVGVATITDCVSESDSPWFYGPYGFVLQDARPVKPANYRGQLGWFDTPFALLDFGNLRTPEN
jgi:ASCH domain